MVFPRLLGTSRSSHQQFTINLRITLTLMFQNLSIYPKEYNWLGERGRGGYIREGGWGRAFIQEMY